MERGFAREAKAELLDILAFTLISAYHNVCCLTENNMPSALNFVEARMKTVVAYQTKLALTINKTVKYSVFRRRTISYSNNSSSELSRQV